MKGDRATSLVFKDNQVLMIFRRENGSEYYVLPGGGIEDNETLEYAVIRELSEETSINASFDKKLISIKDDVSGRMNHICLCKYISGAPKLAADSVEVSRTSDKNTYNPMWVDINKIKNLTLFSEQTKNFLVKYFKK